MASATAEHDKEFNRCIEIMNNFKILHSNRRQGMNGKIGGYLSIFLLVAIVLLPVGCVSKNRFANDHVQWSFVSGDGTWDTNSRKWTVSLSPGETKSAIILLHNTGSTHLTVSVVLWGPPDTISLRGEDLYPIAADGSIDITLSAIAYESAASGSHRYIVDCGNSSNMPR